MHKLSSKKIVYRLTGTRYSQKSADIPQSLINSRVAYADTYNSLRASKNGSLIAIHADLEYPFVISGEIGRFKWICPVTERLINKSKTSTERARESRERKKSAGYKLRSFIVNETCLNSIKEFCKTNNIKMQDTLLQVFNK